MGRWWMMIALTLALAAASGCATAKEPAASGVTIRVRHSYAICAGACTSFEMHVSSRGSVVTYNDLLERTFRYRASPRELAEFRQILSALRPQGERRHDRSCERGLDADGAPDLLDDPRPDDIRIRWNDLPAPAVLTACHRNQAVLRVVQRAIRALGGSPIWGSSAEWAGHT